MNGYSNLASSPPAPTVELPPVPAPAGTGTATAADESKWEGVAVGAATMVRNLSSASHSHSQRFPPVERSKSTNGHRGGFQAAVRRAFSMRRQPASSLSDGYWRIHDGLDDADDQDHQEPEAQPLEEQKKGGAEEPAAQVQQGDAEKIDEEVSSKKKNKKRGGAHIFKACKKLLGFKRV